MTSVQPIPKAATTSLTLQLQQYGSTTYGIGYGIVTEAKKKEQNSGGDQTAFYVAHGKGGGMLVDGDTVQAYNADLRVLAGGELWM